MMFNEELFYSLCEKYGVELSDEFDRPMIKDGDVVRELTENDVKRAFSSCQSYFGYSESRIETRLIFAPYYSNDELAIAC